VRPLVTERSAPCVASAVVAMIRLGVDLEDVITLDIGSCLCNNPDVPANKRHNCKSVTATMAGSPQIPKEEDVLMTPDAVVAHTDGYR
jgi:hypothetical protein